MKRVVVYSTQLMATGGIESHMLEFCKQMNENKVSIFLVVPNTKLLPETEILYKQICARTFFGKQGRSYFRFFWLFIVALKIRFYKIDAFYSNGQGESIYLFKNLVKFKGPWVHHHHTSGDKEDQKTWGKNYLNSLRNCNTLIACSQVNANYMAHYLKRVVKTIPCFSRKIIINKSKQHRAQKIRFGYYGRLIPEKGIDLICKLSSDLELTDAEFHVWGKGEAYDAAFFEKYPNVKYHGSFSGLPALTEAIASIDVFVLLSIHPEGLPICLLEAMSAGLPWLATDRGGIPDIVCDPMSTRIISSKSNYEQIKNALQLFAKDIKEGKVSGEKQELYYIEKFSAPAIVSRWGEVLSLN